ncbi:MAG: glycine cleavage system protein GcvH [Deltaproteobacteria bacterium]|nr:glycine cleavage system protein GcvH [Deltaproteobacteria bacterium]
MAEDIWYNDGHLWATVEDNHAYIGISYYAQEELGDILVVELPEMGDKIVQGKSFGEIESAKTVSDLVSPLSGKVVEVNNDAINEPGIINEDPLGDGWLLEIEGIDQKELKSLMTQEKYERYIKEISK